jgi:hypothetical protein
MEKTAVLSNNAGLVLVKSFLVMFVVNVLVVLLAHMVFPAFVVLGTGTLSVVWALALSMGILSLIDTFTIPFVRVFENYRKRMFSPVEWMIAYLVINFIGIWLISRGAEQLGLGVSSWVVVLILAVVLDMVQGMAMMKLEKMK